jgi:hypothetical protein
VQVAHAQLALSCTPALQRHIAIVWDASSNTITIYRDGTQYATYNTGTIPTFAIGSTIQFGNAYCNAWDTTLNTVDLNTDGGACKNGANPYSGWDGQLCDAVGSCSPMLQITLSRCLFNLLCHRAMLVLMSDSPTDNPACSCLPAPQLLLP